jgi:tetratricopeptide (TPR) repeat protein
VERAGLILRALACLGQERYEEARAALDDLIWSGDGASWAVGVRGWAQGRLGHTRQALADLDEALRRLPGSPLFYMLRADIMAREDDFDQAVQDVSRACQLAPENPHPFLQRAYLLLRRGELPAALADCTLALPLGSDAYHLRARLYLELGYLHLALADTQAALDLGGDDARLLVSHGVVLADLGHIDAAFADCAAALRQDSRCAGAYALRGRLHALRQERSEALTDLSRSLELNPKQPKLYRLRADLFLARQETDAALEDLRKAEDLGVIDASLLSLRGVLYGTKGVFHHALADTDRAIRMDPNQGAYYLARGKVQRMMGDLAAWHDDCQIAVRLRPDLVEANEELAQAAAQIHSWNEVLQSAGRVLAKNPDHTEMHVRRAGTLMVLRRYDEAMVDLNWLLGHLPAEEQPGFQASRGYASLQRGQFFAGMTDCVLAFLHKPGTAVTILGANLLQGAMGETSEHHHPGGR